MSFRNIRKLYGGNSLPPPEDNSDEEYEPLYAKCSPSKYKYQELVLSSHSESEQDSTDAVEVENIASGEMAKKKKKKKKKLKMKQLARSNSKENLEMDEIDKAVMEVKALLGSPPVGRPPAEMDTSVELVHELLVVEHKHLNVSNELKRMFGPEAVDPANRRRGRVPNLNRILRKALIVPNMDNNSMFKKFGLSMSVDRREDGYTYFTFDHSKEYQKVHRAFLSMFNFLHDDSGWGIEEARRNMHVEGLLESADRLFLMEEYTAANTTIELIISYMQYVAHPSFNLTDKKVRLEYKFMENRPFHIAVLKYLHLLSNRACHRTGLELAKLLLNLDPTDPLAVLFIVDTLALRAREHRWLIHAVDHFSETRDAGFLFNIQYSYAMAHFHVATKSKGDVTKADRLLLKAMANFPSVVVKILECANVTSQPRLLNHVLFKTIANQAISRDLKDLIFLYAKLTWSKWREPAVLEWLLRNANSFAEKYDNDLEFVGEVVKSAYEQGGLFGGLPKEMFRYLVVIKSMSNLLVDGAVPRVGRSRSCDPLPPSEGVNRYGYDMASGGTPPLLTNSALYELFASIMPNYGVATPLDFQRLAVLEHQREVMALAGLPEGLNHVAVQPRAEAEAVGGADTDEEGAPALLARHEPARGGAGAEPQGDPDNLVVSIGAVAEAVRHFIDLYEASSGRDANNQNDQQPAERQQGGNGQIDDTPNNDRPNENRQNED